MGVFGGKNNGSKKGAKGATSAAFQGSAHVTDKALSEKMAPAAIQGAAVPAKKSKLRGCWNAFTTFLTIVLFLSGVALLFGPSAASNMNQINMDSRIQMINDLSVTTSESTEGAGVQEDARQYLAIQPELEEYNKSLATTKPIINDPFGFDDTSALLAESGIFDGLIGSISIPAMACNLPLYLGSSEEHMAQGATVVSGTSIPLGGPQTHCVIAAHRGWSTSPMFRDIEDLVEGDLVTITTPWDTLTYAVSSVSIIKPTDSDALRVNSDADMVTLFTCHPYGYNYQRILVHCVRVDNPIAEAGSAAGATVTTATAIDKMKISINHLRSGNMNTVDTERLIRAFGVLLIAIFLLMAVSDIFKRIAHRKNKQ